MNRRLFPVLAVLMIITACGRPSRGTFVPETPPPQNPAPAKTGSLGGTLSSGGVTRHYILHVPSSYRPENAVALILNFHGYTSNSGQEENLSDMSAKADREGFLVVYPDGIDTTWFTGSGKDGQRDQQFIRDLIAALEGQYNIDPKRIYATGISNGGGMTNQLACDMADAIAAIAPVAGAYNFWQNCHPSRPVPVLAFHGLDDNIVPYEGGTRKAIEPPIKEWAAAWATRNGCSSTPDVTTPMNTVTVHTWSNCKEDADVILYAVANHGHSWPGSPVMPESSTSQAINATDLMWDFFQAHPMP
ncbi:MAG TPA: PHB depolymerase family esterase [Anaerolineales bacterium]|nr:PHB depolymerase family esterase [Anaerolineales bacterium]